MDLYKMYGTDEELVESGVKFDFGDGAWIKAKYAGRENEGYYNALISHFESFKDILNEKGKLKAKINDDKVEDALIGIYTDHIFVEWGGFMFKGKEIPNTKQAFAEFCKKLPKFFSEVNRLVSDESNFQKDEVELKN